LLAEKALVASLHLPASLGGAKRMVDACTSMCYLSSLHL